jgi:DNA (cytosine-5)-methyltransferase 1
VLKFIDLFAGIGGLRLGFEKGIESIGLRGECVLASEIDSDANQVYSQNFQHIPAGDIRQIQSLPEHDVLLAGFPCQSFSYAGKKQGFGEIRGTLFFEIMRLIDTHKPKVLILENVRGLITHDRGKTFATIEHEIQLRGYSFYKFVLNSVNFGLPQNRVRVYMIGVLNASPQFNLISDVGLKDTHAYNAVQLNSYSLNDLPPKVKDILEENPDSSFDCSPEFVQALNKVVQGDFNKLHGVRLIDYRGGNSIHSWELGLRGECSEDEINLMNLLITERRLKKFGKHQDGKALTFEQIASFFKHPNLPKILESLVKKRYLKITNGQYKPVSGNFSFEVYKFLDPEKVSVTLVASDANRIGVYHNNRVRRITPREAARLQGFPDSFQLHSNPKKAFYQLGNSVSINVITAITQDVISNIWNNSILLLGSGEQISIEQNSNPKKHDLL